uniref:Ground-like domain-containing protein n=1 Tax=Syphacia muris TaxID=451379 RepID=A0A0N5APT0_9BILA
LIRNSLKSIKNIVVYKNHSSLNINYFNTIKKSISSFFFQNMVENDCESSKRAIQEAAEYTFGDYYNVICGTGFFSYIAHTDEYCLVSTLGINCYIFSPVCSRPVVAPFSKAKAHGTKSAANKN